MEPDAGSGEREMVVLVHGIWMTGLDMTILGRRLAAAGFAWRRFQYRTVRRSPAENAAHLARFLDGLEVETLHLVAHSLGGIVLLHLFDRFSVARPGRVVMLSTPARGSGVARRIAGIPLLRRSLGRSIEKGVLGDAPPWRGERDLGIIAGNRGFGMGSLIGGVEKPNDGTVAVSETRLPGATDSCTMGVSHTGILYSRTAARAVCDFLHGGRFKEETYGNP